MKIKFIGKEFASESTWQNDLLLRIISSVSGAKIQVTTKTKDAELVIVYPYVVGSYAYKFRWLLLKLWGRIYRRSSKYRPRDLRWILGLSESKILFVSHENLDRPYWWNMIGCLLVESDIPRLTFWPKEIDPKGERFPYWYNYVDWPNYPRENTYERFGRLYKVDELTKPLQQGNDRIPHAVAIGSHFDYPRSALFDSVSKNMRIDCFGGMGESFLGGKLDLMRKYKYAFCPENSAGYGYDTEKLPEAWVAGCIPVGVYLNPFSEFNPKIICNINENAVVYDEPLLLKWPDLKNVERYVKAIIY